MATEWMRCPGCRGEVTVSENLQGTVLCPNCNQVVCRVDSETGTKWKPPAPVPVWMKPWGYVAAGVGALAFAASVFADLSEVTGGWENADGSEWLGAIVSGALNPLFFIGLPLGLYWLSQCGELKRLFSQPKKRL